MSSTKLCQGSEQEGVGGEGMKGGRDEGLEISQHRWGVAYEEVM